MKMTLKKNLQIGFGIAISILIISSVISYMSISNLLQSAALVRNTNDAVRSTNQVLSTLKDAETGQRGFLLTGADEFLAPYNGSHDSVNNLIAHIKTISAGNAEQQRNIDKLANLIDVRFTKLASLISQRRISPNVDVNDMRLGRDYMNSVREQVKAMTDQQQILLEERTAKLDRFSQNTPWFILGSAMLAIIITILFYLKIKKDIDERIKLQSTLEQKDIDISKRLDIIQHISGKISKGDYSIRVNDDSADILGGISQSLNEMAYSLQTSFNILSDKEWLQAGLADFNIAIVGEDNMKNVTQKMMNFLANYTHSLVGAFYLYHNEKYFTLENGFALLKNTVPEKLLSGEGLGGQCAISKKPILVNSIKENNINISFATASVKPANIIVFPVIFEGIVRAVVELGSLLPYSKREIDFFNTISENIGVAINTVQNRQKVQELLEETQSQSEELMTQQSELEQINAELEAQAQHLQTSEEELKVQSEELIETNSLLEERSALLEERNQLIQQKNVEINKRAEDLALSTKYKSEFLANMSHELRTPLNSILLLSRLMSENNDENLTAEQVQYAQVIQSSGNGLLQLIDEILDLSKIESGKMTVENLPVPIKNIATDINSLFEPVAKQQLLEWKIIRDADVPEIIITDKMRLDQVLKNLLSNALKFTSKGFVHFSIKRSQNRPGYISFTVKDSGIGISADKQEMIFEAFQQEDGSTRRKFGGTGLGLSISRELAKLLGGEIVLTSKQGEGSEFTCSIPINIEAVVEEKPVQRNVIIPAPEKIQKNDHNSKYDTSFIPEEMEDDRNNILPGEKIILVIEDDVLFAAALLDYSRKKGYKTLVAVRGDKGIEMADKYQPAGILLDVQLPIKNGFEVMEALTKNVRTRHIPVHMMSSYELKKESLMKGAVAFINKPVAFEQLNTIFEKIEFVLHKKDKKVLIIEENNKHAKALAYYLGTYNVNAEIFHSIEESISSLQKKEVDCVILDMGVTNQTSETLFEKIKDQEGLEDLPVILFTGKTLSAPEEFRIKKYADAIVMKTANSYQRILDEVSLFLHIVQEEQNKKGKGGFERSVLQENVLKGKNILLADDDVRNIFSMTKALEKYQLKIIPALDGQEALQLLSGNDVDLILMDMMMPNMDGFESIKAIRKIKQYKNLPIIAVTAKAMSGDREKCIAAGASDYISKPVDVDQLVSLLRIWLYEKGY
jgi:signal transduction histidine kinase/DNA-binding response OmpR family regulator/CHASE3 domain sensor protein